VRLRAALVLTGLLAALPPAALSLGAPSTATAAAPGTVSVFAPVGSPYFPALPHVVGDRVYEGTYDDPAGDNCAEA
jgi:hypothetical protein